MENRKLESIIHFKEFANELSDELVKLQMEDSSKSVKVFQKNCFGSTSEYFGEFRIILHGVLDDGSHRLDKPIIYKMFS